MGTALSLASLRDWFGTPLARRQAWRRDTRDRLARSAGAIGWRDRLALPPSGTKRAAPSGAAPGHDICRRGRDERRKDHSMIRAPALALEIETTLRRIYDRYRPDVSGAVADYIPELARMPPDLFGLAACHQSGEVVVVGDAEVPFTIQSVSKSFTLALLIDRIGAAAAFALVGTEPSGDPFNAIALDARTRRPHNPMVNAGAIAVAARLHAEFGAEAFAQVHDTMSRAAGRSLGFDERTFASETATGHRNRAIGHLLRAVDAFDAPVDDVLDLYFRQCSILVTARDLAVMGATLANVGVNPLTGAPVFGPEAVRETLSVMFTCGMYDGAGDWACRVGVPAKSGVSGGILAVVNRQLGISSFSPRVDPVGNSVRGRQACATLAADLGLHAFDSTNMGSTFLSALR